MARRKKTARKPRDPKTREPLPTSFKCPFCDEETSVSVKIDEAKGEGRLRCKSCGQKYQTRLNPLTEPVDVYGDWIDACEAVNKDSSAARAPASPSSFGQSQTQTRADPASAERPRTNAQKTRSRGAQPSRKSNRKPTGRPAAFILADETLAQAEGRGPRKAPTRSTATRALDSQHTPLDAERGAPVVEAQDPSVNRELVNASYSLIEGRAQDTSSVEQCTSPQLVSSQHTSSEPPPEQSLQHSTPHLQSKPEQDSAEPPEPEEYEASSLPVNRFPATDLSGLTQSTSNAIGNSERQQGNTASVKRPLPSDENNDEEVDSKKPKTYESTTQLGTAEDATQIYESPFQESSNFCDLLPYQLSRCADLATESESPTDLEDPAKRGDMLIESTIWRAIACVSEAISEETSSVRFSLIDAEHFDTFRTLVPGDSCAPTAEKVARGENEAFIPRVDARSHGRQHASLFVLERDGNNAAQFALRHYDTAPSNEPGHRGTKDTYGASVRRGLLRAGWAASIPPLDIIVTNSSDHSGRQQADWECGFFVIFYAWAHALNFDFSSFTGVPQEKLEDFQIHAPEIVNLALGGFLDSETISTFLRCYDFVKPRASRTPWERHFSRTMPFARATDLRQRLAWLRLNRELHTAAVAASFEWHSLDVPSVDELLTRTLPAAKDRDWSHYTTRALVDAYIMSKPQKRERPARAAESAEALSRMAAEDARQALASVERERLEQQRQSASAARLRFTGVARRLNEDHQREDMLDQSYLATGGLRGGVKPEPQNGAAAEGPEGRATPSSPRPPTDTALGSEEAAQTSQQLPASTAQALDTELPKSSTDAPEPSSSAATVVTKPELEGSGEYLEPSGSPSGLEYEHPRVPALPGPDGEDHQGTVGEGQTAKDETPASSSHGVEQTIGGTENDPTRDEDDSEEHSSLFGDDGAVGPNSAPPTAAAPLESAAGHTVTSPTRQVFLPGLHPDSR